MKLFPNYRACRFDLATGPVLDDKSIFFFVANDNHEVTPATVAKALEEELRSRYTFAQERETRLALADLDPAFFPADFLPRAAQILEEKGVVTCERGREGTVLEVTASWREKIDHPAPRIPYFLRNIDFGAVDTIDYTNYRGERGLRRILPMPGGLRFGASEWHPGKQWLLDAIDLDKGEPRTFAMKDIHAWKQED